MFLNIGDKCFYVSEYGERGPLHCTITTKESVGGEDKFVLGIEITGAPDSVFGRHFFSEVQLQGQRFIDKIVIVRCYVRNKAWLSEAPKYGDDVVDVGFLCTEIGLREYFPSLRQTT